MPENPREIAIPEFTQQHKWYSLSDDCLLAEFAGLSGHGKTAPRFNESFYRLALNCLRNALGNTHTPLLRKIFRGLVRNHPDFATDRDRAEAGL